MEYSILWKAPGSKEWEIIDTAKDEDERDFLIQEYRIAYGNEGDFEYATDEA